MEFQREPISVNQHSQRGLKPLDKEIALDGASWYGLFVSRICMSHSNRVNKEWTLFSGAGLFAWRNRQSITLVTLIATACGCFRAEGGDGAPDAVLTNRTGTVQYKRPDQPIMIPALEQQWLFARDLLRTLANSSAVVWMQRGNTSIRLRELSTLEIQPPETRSRSWLNLVRGAL